MAPTKKTVKNTDAPATKKTARKKAASTKKKASKKKSTGTSPRPKKERILIASELASNEMLESPDSPELELESTDLILPSRSMEGYVIPLEEWLDRSPEELEDLKLFHEMRLKGVRHLRIRSSWKHVEPEPGKLSRRHLKNLRTILGRARIFGLHTILDLGGSEEPERSDLKIEKTPADYSESFRQYAENLVRELGDLVDLFITFSSPNLLFLEFLSPEKRFQEGSEGYAQVLALTRARLLAHFRAYEAIHQVQKRLGRPEPGVSLALQHRLFIPQRAASGKDMDRAAFLNHRFHRIWQDCLLTGTLSLLESHSETLFPGRGIDFYAFEFGGTTKVGFRLLSRKRFFLQLGESSRTASGLARSLSQLSPDPELAVSLVDLFYDTSNLEFRKELEQELEHIRNNGFSVDGYYHSGFMTQEMHPRS